MGGLFLEGLIIGILRYLLYYYSQIISGYKSKPFHIHGNIGLKVKINPKFHFAKYREVQTVLFPFERRYFKVSFGTENVNCTGSPSTRGLSLQDNANFIILNKRITVR